MPITLTDKVIKTFKHLYDYAPTTIITVPGRINLIGEHTDYSEGFVLPVAINLGIVIALSPRPDNLVRLYSVDFDEHLEIDLTTFVKEKKGWQEYVKGVAWALLDEGYELHGWQGVVAGNIPIGAGLSSSAALEIAAAKAFSITENLSLTSTELAKIGKKAESDWVGVNVGIMDQLISAAGKADHAVKLDCRTLDIEYVPIPENVGFVVLDTMTRRELTHSAYNTRHNEVKEASSALGIPVLRDATLPLLEKNVKILTPSIYKRARHVLTENERVHAFISAMRITNLQEMGHLINASHDSLRDDFEVSSNELNIMVELARNQPVCLGARMMGAGFGGCALGLIMNENVNIFSENVRQAYFNETGIQPHIFKVVSADGVQALTINIEDSKITYR